MPTEQDMVDAAVAHLEQRGFPATTEVGCFSRSVDVVYLDAGEIVTVEMKRRAWKRAIIQARDHALAADRAYICLLSVPDGHKMLHYAEKAGVGVLEWQDDGSMIVKLEPSIKLNMDGTRQWLVDSFERRCQMAA